MWSARSSWHSCSWSTPPAGFLLVSLPAALLTAGVLCRTWVRAGRPGGIRDLAAQAEAIDE